VHFLHFFFCEYIEESKDKQESKEGELRYEESSEHSTAGGGVTSGGPGPVQLEELDNSSSSDGVSDQGMVTLWSC